MATDDKNQLIDTTTWTDKRGNEQTEPPIFVYRSADSNKNSNLAKNDWNDPDKLYSLGENSGDFHEEELFSQLTNPEKQGQEAQISSEGTENKDKDDD